MPNLFVPMIFAWLNFWRTCFSVSPSMYINPFMFPICPGVILSELSSSLRSNSLGVFDKQFRDCFRCVFSIAIRISLVPYTKPINIKKAEGHSPIRKRGSPSPIHTNRRYPPVYHGEHLSVSLCIMQFLDFSLAQKSAKRFFSQNVKTRSVYDRTKITNCWLKGFTNLLFFCPIILNSVFMKYQVLFEHPCLQMKRYFCSTLMLSAWWENRTDQPGAQYHFIITDRLFLWCNAPISLSFFVSLCRKYCVLTVNFEK